MSEAAQRDNVARKYELIYGALDKVASRVIDAGASAGPGAIYSQLKVLLPGVWAACVEAETALSGAEILARASAHNGAPKTWTEFGVPRQGSTLDFHRVQDALLVRLMREHAPPECDLVLDLGCGWGHRMFDCWRAGIAARACYVGSDRPEASRALVTRIGRLFPAMNSRWFRFDFLDPNFSDAPDARRIVVYTFHAIEQITRLGALLFDKLFERYPAASILGIHCEPVSAQLADRMSDRDYAATHGYNTDLVHQIAAHPRIALVSTQAAAIDAGAGNSTSVIVWRDRAR